MHNEEVRNLYFSSNIIVTVTKPKGWNGWGM